jgi:hypothetical protein
MELKGMGTSAYKMGGEITKETLELITSKINKIKAYNQEADHDVLNKPNGDCNVMLKEIWKGIWIGFTNILKK